MNRIYLLIFILFVNSCASITKGQSQVLSIDTPNCPGATCRISNNEGTYYINRTPGTVTINKSGSNLNIVCGTPGSSEQAISTDSSVDGMSWGNILIGGIIGAAVDVGTGAAYEYPSLITHPLDCRDQNNNSGNDRTANFKKLKSDSSNNSNESKTQRLKELKALYDDGLISKENFETKQLEILRD